MYLGIWAKKKNRRKKKEIVAFFLQISQVKSLQVLSEEVTADQVLLEPHNFSSAIKNSDQTGIALFVCRECVGDILARSGVWFLSGVANFKIISKAFFTQAVEGLGGSFREMECDWPRDIFTCKCYLYIARFYQSFTLQHELIQSDCHSVKSQFISAALSNGNLIIKSGLRKVQ